MRLIIEPFLLSDAGNDREINFTKAQKKRFRDLVYEAVFHSENVLDYMGKTFGRKRGGWYPDYDISYED